LHPFPSSSSPPEPLSLPHSSNSISLPFLRPPAGLKRPHDLFPRRPPRKLSLPPPPTVRTRHPTPPPPQTFNAASVSASFRNPTWTLLPTPPPSPPSFLFPRASHPPMFPTRFLGVLPVLKNPEALTNDRLDPLFLPRPRRFFCVFLWASHNTRGQVSRWCLPFFAACPRSPLLFFGPFFSISPCNLGAAPLHLLAALPDPMPVSFLSSFPLTHP